MPDTDDIPTYPITGWNIRSVQAYDLLLLQLPFLSHSMQKLEEADPGRNYSMTLEQAEELRDALDRSIQKMKNSGPPISPVPGH